MSGRAHRVAAVLHVQGTVQGVGFRPFVYRLARALGIAGWVRNDADGVRIHAEGAPENLDRFHHAVRVNAPSCAKIDIVGIEAAPAHDLRSFQIVPSAPPTRPRVRVPRDLAICAACAAELFEPRDRRFRYPFTNCTQCGPRYSIIARMPYDRPSTSMRRFVLCAECRQEYRDPGDRRFHAQPNACPRCGPRVVLLDREGRELAREDAAIRAGAARLEAGDIVALKGLGGFQLLVRADLPEPVSRLRERKCRPSKPLAVMARSLEVARRLGEVGAIEESLLSDPANPIVLLERHVAKDTAEGTRVAPQVAPGMNTIGLFLPTTPLHQLLLNDLDFPIVATSGNRGDEPLALDRSEALANLSDIADVFLDHDRPVERRIDDSVVRVIDDRPVSFRLARGYAPLALPALESFANKAALAPVVAVGGHQKVALALWSGSQAILGPHVGDMDTLATRAAFSAQYDQLCALYGFEPVAIACDLHPDYFTTQWAGVQGKSLIPVQHHHAHAVSAMVEHDLLDREVFALVWDGTGYGPDGTIWGGEVLVARVASYQRVASLRPFALAGNEAAIREPWRIALVMLAEAPGNEPALSSSWLLDRFRVSRREAETVLQMARKGINTSWTSSVGRLFDAVASIVLGIREVSYEGEAAILLESVAESHESSAYKPPIHLEREVEAYRGDSFVIRGDWRPMLRAIVRDVAGGVATGVVAARFHNTLARWASALVARQPPRDVVLGGGCFQNRLLAERCRAAIEDVSSARVYGPGVIPPGDGGLAVGQLGVALAQLKQNKTYRTNTTNKGGANVSRNSWAGD